MTTVKIELKGAKVDLSGPIKPALVVDLTLSVGTFSIDKQIRRDITPEMIESLLSTVLGGDLLGPSKPT